MIGFIVFIVLMIGLSEFIGTLDGMRDFIPFMISLIVSYRFTKKLIAERKAAQEEDDREDLKEELRQEIREEMKNEKKLPEIMQTQASEEEPYYPEVKYFHK